MHKGILTFCTGFFLAGAALAGTPRPEIGPYVQAVTPRSATLCWRTEQAVRGRAVVTQSGKTVADVSESEPANRHVLRVDGLTPGAKHLYRVGSTDALGETFTFRTPPAGKEPIRFVVFGDPQFDSQRPDDGITRLLKQVALADPDFVLIAGDLVERGGSDADWDLFWHTLCSDRAYSLGFCAPIYPCLGNHEYYFGKDGSYRQPFSEQAVRKYLDYFELPANGAADPDHRERYYSFTYGPAAFIVLDTCNDDTSPEYDTSKLLTGGKSPGFHPGSKQYQWLERELAKAQKESVFTFVMFHHSPYSAGVHGDPAERQSGYPVRVLDPLFHRYGVAAVFCGHDHVNQRAQTERDGHVLPYLTATASAPRERMAGWRSWTSDPGEDKVSVKRFDGSNRAFVRVDVAPADDGTWSTRLTFYHALGDAFDQLVISQHSRSSPEAASRGNRRVWAVMAVVLATAAGLAILAWAAKARAARS